MAAAASRTAERVSVSRAFVCLLGRGAQRVRDAREVLDDAVVQVGGDPPAFVVGRLERALEELLAILLAAPQAAREPPGERHLHEPEQEEADEQERRERDPDPAPGGRDGRRSLVRLEDQRRAVGRADGEVHLVDVTQAALEPVLCAFEATELRTRIARAKHVELLVVERERLADQPRLVGVDDAAADGPDLDPRDAVTEDALLHDPIELRQRTLVARQDAGLQGRLDDALAGEHRKLPRVPQRLAPPEAPEDEHRADEEEREHDEAGERELRHSAGGAGRAFHADVLPPDRPRTNVQLWRGPRAAAVFVP